MSSAGVLGGIKTCIWLQECKNCLTKSVPYRGGLQEALHTRCSAGYRFIYAAVGLGQDELTAVDGEVLRIGEKAYRSSSVPDQ
jgi:hypothetical protein